MKRLPFRHIILVIFLLPSFFHAYANPIDSLKAELKKELSKDDRISTYIALGDAHLYYFSYDSSLVAYEKALQLTPENEPLKKAKLFERIGEVYHALERLEPAKSAYKFSHEHYLKANADPSFIARSLSLIGRSFYDQSSYDSAMVYYKDAQKIYEQHQIINEERGYLLHFIGSVFKRQDNFDKACEYYYQEIEFGKTNGLLEVEAEGLYLAGICLNDDREILQNDLRCLEIYTDLKIPGQMALMHELLGIDYINLGMYDSALYHQQKSLEQYRVAKDIGQLASLLGEISHTLIYLGRYSEAEDYIKESEEIAHTAGIKKYIHLKHVYQTYCQLYRKQGKFELALEAQERMYLYQDSSRNNEQADLIQEMEFKYDTEKKEAQLQILEKDKKLAEESAAHQTLISTISVIGGIFVLAIGVFIFFKLRESQKQKKIITEQKIEVENQKQIIEEKNKDITDSMVYASSIQQAILSSEEYIGNMFSDFFVLFKPKDIVSGDFYWAYETEDGKKMIAAGDCTGHGVPGAMMNMLANTLLNEIVVENNAVQPSEILNKLREQVKKALQNNKADGMDMCFCCITEETIEFCGANLPLYLMRDQDIIEYKGNKQPVGYYSTGEKPFEQISIAKQSGDKIYLFSDGYADQFGGEKGKKYKYKTFKNKLIEIHNKPFKEQCSLLDVEFETWKGDLEQIDDVCVVGVQL